MEQRGTGSDTESTDRSDVGSIRSKSWENEVESRRVIERVDDGHSETVDQLSIVKAEE